MAETKICPCPCKRPMSAKRSNGKPRFYATAGCRHRDTSRTKERTAKAAARADALPSKTAAYQQGYKAGYALAWRWWKRRLDVAVASVQRKGPREERV
jgi:hypothetical protein